ncbi:MAG: NAD(P)/FAD-dependent oxidoreductase [Bacteroidota bacterium]
MRVLVVGAGIMGLSVAEALLTAGHRVMVYEQGRIPNDRASSADQHRLIRFPYGDQDGYAAMVAPAYAAWGRLWQRLGACHYVETGTLVVGRRAGGWMAQSAAGLERLRHPFERLDAAALAARFPLLTIHPDEHGLYLASGGLLRARQILEDLAARVVALGGGLFPRGRVVAVDPATGRIDFTDGTRAGGDAVIVTAGPWLPDLLPDFAARVTPSRQAYAYLEPPAEMHASWARHPMLLDIGETQSESGFYLVPPAGGTGMKISDHSFSLRGHPDRDREGRPEDVAACLAVAARHLAGFDRYRVTAIGTCFYTVAAQERFIAEQRGAAWILTGFSGHGFKFGPLIAETLAEVLAGRRAAGDFRDWLAGHWISGRSGAMEDPAPTV